MKKLRFSNSPKNLKKIPSTKKKGVEKIDPAKSFGPDNTFNLRSKPRWFNRLCLSETI